MESSQNLSQNSHSDGNSSTFQVHASEENTFDESLEEEDEFENPGPQAEREETVTTPTGEGSGTIESESEKEVVFQKKVEENRQKNMMRDINEFFSDEGKLSRMWNLVKAINTSDDIQKEKEDKQDEPGKRRGEGPSLSRPITS